MTKKARRKYAPRAGTLAAFVLAQPVTASPDDVAKLARAHDRRFAKCTAQSVYNVRYQYGLTNQRPTLDGAREAEVTKRAEDISARRRGARVSIPDGVPSKLVEAITRYGTEPARRVIEHLETQRYTADVLARESA